MMEKLNRQIAVLAVVIVALILLDVALAMSDPLYTYFQGTVIAKLGNMSAIDITENGWLCGTQSNVGPDERFVLLELRGGRKVCMRVAPEEYDSLMMYSIVDIDWSECVEIEL